MSLGWYSSARSNRDPSEKHRDMPSQEHPRAQNPRVPGGADRRGGTSNGKRGDGGGGGRPHAGSRHHGQTCDLLAALHFFLPEQVRLQTASAKLRRRP